MTRSGSTATEDLTTDLKLTRYPRSLAATLAAFPSVSLVPQLGSLIPPTRDGWFTKKCCPRNTRSTPMKQNLRDKVFVPFVCSVGKLLLHARIAGRLIFCAFGDSVAIVLRTRRSTLELSRLSPIRDIRVIRPPRRSPATAGRRRVV